MAHELSTAHGLAVDRVVLQGSVLDQLTQEANRAEVGIVAVGARGAGFVRHFLLGSTAERLLRKLAHPVLVFKQVCCGSYRRVLVAVDFSAWSAHLVGLARAVVAVVLSAHLVL